MKWNEIVKANCARAQGDGVQSVPHISHSVDRVMITERESDRSRVLSSQQATGSHGGACRAPAPRKRVSQLVYASEAK